MQLKQYEFKPNSSSTEDWKTGTIFGNFTATRIRIQGPPGIKFCLNAGSAYVALGYDGVYELDLGTSGSYVSALQFEEASLLRFKSGEYTIPVNILVELYVI